LTGSRHLVDLSVCARSGRITRHSEKGPLRSQTGVDWDRETRLGPAQTASRRSGGHSTPAQTIRALAVKLTLVEGTPVIGASRPVYGRSARVANPLAGIRSRESATGVRIARLVTEAEACPTGATTPKSPTLSQPGDRAAAPPGRRVPLQKPG